jgi:GH24 family phage-related lysozyme (muramidase)
MRSSVTHEYCEVGKALGLNALRKSVFNEKCYSDMVNSLEKALHIPTWERSPAGKYTEPLVQRIARLQQDAYTRQSQSTVVKDRLVCPKVNGQLDDETMAYINAYYFGKNTQTGQINTLKIWPDVDWPEEQKFDHYNAICKQFGHEVTNGKVTLLGIRGVMLFACRSRARIGDHARAYDDSFILLDFREGNKKVREFAGATHSYQLDSKGSSDANFDGKPDMGSIRENDGNNLYKITPLPGNKKKGNFYICKVTGKQPANATDWQPGCVLAYRDANQDQTISADERYESINRKVMNSQGKILPNAKQNSTQQVVKDAGDYANGVLFHPGFTAKTVKGKAYSSIACQTARGENVNFIAEIAKKNKGIDYLLLNVDDIVFGKTVKSKDPSSNDQSNQEDDTDEAISRYVKNAKKWEGVVQHLYLDTKGLVTVGIGNLTNTLNAAQALPFVNSSTGQAATKGEIQTNFNAVKGMKAAMVATSYRQNPNLVLTNEEIEKLAGDRIRDEFLPQIRKVFSGFDGYPIEAKEVIVDITYNVGTGKIRSWKNLIKHAEASDWSAASEEAVVSSSSQSRNNWRKSTMASAGSSKETTND